LAKVYDALGAEPKQAAPSAWPYHADLQQVGAAFENVLLPGLPASLANLAFVDELAQQDPVAARVVEHAALHPSGENMTRPLRSRLASVGLTPMSFLLGADAVADTIDRYIDYGLLDASQGPIAVAVSASGFGVGNVLTAAQLTAEIPRAPNVRRRRRALAEPVARYKSKLLIGFAATATDGGLALTRVKRASQRDLFMEWQSDEASAGAMTGMAGVTLG
jgi:hypothetical protein